MLCWPFRLWLPGVGILDLEAPLLVLLVQKRMPHGKMAMQARIKDYWSEECLNAAAVTRRKIENAAHARPDGKAGRHQHAHRKDDHLHALRLCHAAIMAPREA